MIFFNIYLQYLTIFTSVSILPSESTPSSVQAIMLRKIYVTLSDIKRSFNIQYILTLSIKIASSHNIIIFSLTIVKELIFVESILKDQSIFLLMGMYNIHNFSLDRALNPGSKAPTSLASDPSDTIFLDQREI